MKLQTKSGILRVNEKYPTRANAAMSSPIIRRKCVEFAVTTRTIDDVAIVNCGGKLIFEKEAAALCRVVSDLVQRYRSVVVNMGELVSIDGNGLGTLAQCIRDAQQAGTLLVLCRVPRKVKQVLDLTRLSTMVQIAATEHEAVERSRAAA
jgi:anti-anti-sigma factor